MFHFFANLECQIRRENSNCCCFSICMGLLGCFVVYLCIYEWVLLVFVNIGVADIIGNLGDHYGLIHFHGLFPVLSHVHGLPIHRTGIFIAVDHM